MIKDTGANKVPEALQPKSVPDPNKGGGGKVVGAGTCHIMERGPMMIAKGDEGSEKPFVKPSDSEVQKIGKI